MNRFMLAVQQSAIYLNNHMPQFQAAQEREKVRVYAEERTMQGAINLVFGILTFVVGGSALVMSGGTMWPIVNFAFKSGALALSLSGFSNSIEAGWNIYYGLSGDGKSVAVNPIRDTMFIGKGELYHSLEQIFGLTTGVFIPIAKTKKYCPRVMAVYMGNNRRVSNWTSSLSWDKASWWKRRNRTVDELIWGTSWVGINLLKLLRISA